MANASRSEESRSMRLNHRFAQHNPGWRDALPVIPNALGKALQAQSLSSRVSQKTKVLARK